MCVLITAVFRDQVLQADSIDTLTDARRCAINFYRANHPLRNVLNPPPKFSGKPKVLTAPTLLIWGTGDTAITIELARLSAEISELVTVEYVEDCSHWVQQDNPTEVNRLMRKFLSE